MPKMPIVLCLLFLGVCYSKFLGETIKLPDPKKEGGTPLFKAMKDRVSTREYQDGTDLSLEQLSQLLWSTYGPNRPDLKKTVPSSRSKYPLDIYVFRHDGTYRYKPNENELEVVNNRDFRALTGTQDFVAFASVNLVLIGDLEKEEGLPDLKTKKTKIDFDAGHCVSAVVNYASAEGLKSLARGAFIEAGILEVLQLDPNRWYIPITLSVGY